MPRFGVIVDVLAKDANRLSMLLHYFMDDAWLALGTSKALVEGGGLRETKRHIWEGGRCRWWA